MNIDKSFLDTLKHFRNYLGANSATKALGFISIPVFTRILSPEDYGIINLVTSYVGILVIVMSLNFHSSISRYFYEKTDDFKSFFSLSFLGSLLLVLINGAVVFLIFDYIKEFITLPRNVIAFIIPLVIFSLFRSVFSQVFAPQLRSGLIAKANIIHSYSGFVASVIFVLILSENKYLGIVYSSSIVGFLFLIFYGYKLKNYFKVKLKIAHLKYIISYSTPLIPYALSGLILAQIDRIMISKINGYGDTGLYSFAYNVGMLLTMVSASISSAWTPKYFKYMNDKKYLEHDSDLNYIVSIVFFAGMGLIFFAEELGYLLASNIFHSSLDIIPLVVIGYIFQFMFTIYGRNIGYSKKTIYSTLIYLTAGIINIVLNAYTIPKYGYKSAALNTTVSFFILFILAYFTSEYIIKIRTYKLKNFLLKLLVIFGSLFYILSLDFLIEEFITKLIFKLPGFLILTMILYKITTYITKQEN